MYQKFMFNFLFLSALLLTVFSGCTPGLGPNLNLDSIPEKKAAYSWDNYQPAVKVIVNKFLDSRANRKIGEFKGQELFAQGDLGLSVQRAFEEQLKSTGAKLALFEAPQINGEIKIWQVKVEQGFPSVEVSAEAEINIEVSDSKGLSLYRARYAGSFSEKNPLFSQKKVEDVLGQAMAEAISQAVSDRELISRLTRS